jgi:hypothetical protein
MGMNQNGEKNEKFGLYRTLCCGSEIVIREGASFPDCPNHPNLRAVWNFVDAEIVELEPRAVDAQNDTAA